MFPMFFFGVWALVGVAFLSVALILRRVNRNKMQRCTRTAAGTVVEVVYRRRGNGERGAYHPVVEYAVDGEIFRMHSGARHNPPQYQGGESVNVHYDPEQPEYFYIGDNGTAHVLEKVFLLAGLVCILLGSLIAYAAA